MGVGGSSVIGDSSSFMFSESNVPFGLVEKVLLFQLKCCSGTWKIPWGLEWMCQTHGLATVGAALAQMVHTVLGLFTLFALFRSPC